MSNKNTYFTIAAVAVLALAGVLLFGRGSEAPVDNTVGQNQEQKESTNNNNSNNDNGTAMETQTVVYTDGGFSPETLVVAPGTTVVFENQSSKSMWVASDPHPTHTAVPEFDHLRGVSTGATYEFTFTEVGKYDYHNHLSPRDGGSIVVE